MITRLKLRAVAVVLVMLWCGSVCADESTPPGAEPKASAEPASSLLRLSPSEDWHPTPPGNEIWGVLDPGKGFVLGRTPKGELSISAYAMLRYINQMPSSQNFTDHLGNEHPVDNRQDFFSHRIMIWFKGWVYSPKLVYTIFLWTVNATDQDAIFANIGYQFDPKFNLYGGIAGNGGSRSLLGSHPYWLGHDRVMADEFFRPYFTMGLWAQGEVLPGLWYHALGGNNNSSLGIKAAQLDRDPTVGGSLWWMPTTKEFGPRGGYGDYEMHEELATRFGVSGNYSPEQRYTEAPDEPQNTTLKLADGLNVYSTGALAPEVTVNRVDYQVLAADAGLKYKGFFLQTEFYNRWLNNFEADGPVPVDEIVDWGFYVQAAFFPIPKKLELYAVTSQIFGDSSAGFGDSSEYIVGTNLYPFDTRDARLNLQLMDVNNSPVGSTFGYYTAGQDGQTIAVSFSLMF